MTSDLQLSGRGPSPLRVAEEPQHNFSYLLAVLSLQTVAGAAFTCFLFRVIVCDCVGFFCFLFFGIFKQVCVCVYSESVLWTARTRTHTPSRYSNVNIFWVDERIKEIQVQSDQSGSKVVLVKSLENHHHFTCFTSCFFCFAFNTCELCFALPPLSTRTTRRCRPCRDHSGHFSKKSVILQNGMEASSSAALRCLNDDRILELVIRHKRFNASPQICCSCLLRRSVMWSLKISVF